MTEKFGDKNVLFFKGKNYIPKDETLRQDIARMFHDHEPRRAGNVQRHQTTLLVAGITYFHQKLRARMWRMSTIQN